MNDDPFLLILSPGERMAIDWVGDRYSHGNDLFRLLWAHSTQIPDDVDWDYKGDIRFYIPLDTAKRIHKLLVREDGSIQLDCFNGELSHKIGVLVNSISNAKRGIVS
jgi:hypothetical protein